MTKNGNGHVPKEVVIDTVAPVRFRKGQRVLWHGQTGIVRSSRNRQVTVYWGTRTNAEGRPGTEVITTVPASELELSTQKVVTADEIAQRTKEARDAEIKRW